MRYCIRITEVPGDSQHRGLIFILVFILGVLVFVFILVLVRVFIFGVFVFVLQFGVDLFCLIGFALRGVQLGKLDLGETWRNSRSLAIRQLVVEIDGLRIAVGLCIELCERKFAQRTN